MTSKETALPIKDAVARLNKAQAALADAQAEVEHAGNALDWELSQVGWQRNYAAGVDALYVKLGSSPVGLDVVLAHELRAAA